VSRAEILCDEGLTGSPFGTADRNSGRDRRRRSSRPSSSKPSPRSAPGSVHTYTRWSQITQETIDGRAWEGVHYRFSDETAAKVGKQVAAWDLPRLYRLGL